MDAEDIERERDAEIISMAARAAGLSVQWSNNCGDFSIGEPYSRGEKRWNPLEFDQDAFRLAVQLKLFPQMMNMGQEVGIEDLDIFESFSPDPYAATRRAIVRAAAEVGRKMVVDFPHG
ncbi:hypothetical protein [Pseudomonas viridiflava]|uniref:hypothetical protein n=1 Tax=Pseudomonas viridiflava TaxID=33069 RepID=UPI000F010754|nr:hypothetical protein [Pseudomonas viridiflava]